MGKFYRLDPKQAGLLIIDVQDKLFPLVERACDVMKAITLLIKACRILKIPIFVSEQYPQGLGSTVASLKVALDPQQNYWSKTCFSCLEDQAIIDTVQKLPITQWIVVGIEAHVCVQQTVRDLLNQGKEVVVLNDAITSRSIFDYSTAIAEMRDFGARISSVETVIFELVHDSKHPEFRQISQLIKG